MEILRLFLLVFNHLYLLTNFRASVCSRVRKCSSLSHRSAFQIHIFSLSSPVPFTIVCLCPQQRKGREKNRPVFVASEEFLTQRQLSDFTLIPATWGLEASGRLCTGMQIELASHLPGRGNADSAAAARFFSLAKNFYFRPPAFFIYLGKTK